MGPSQLPLNVLREDQEFILCGGQHSSQPGSASVLLLAPSSNKPSLETLKKLEDEYSLRNELDSRGRLDSAHRSHTMRRKIGGGNDRKRSCLHEMHVPQTRRDVTPIVVCILGLCVAADRGCNHFRHGHRPEWRCYSRSSSHDRQPKHWIETRLLY